MYKNLNNNNESFEFKVLTYVLMYLNSKVLYIVEQTAKISIKMYYISGWLNIYLPCPLEIFFCTKMKVCTLCHKILFICFRGVKHVPCPVEEFQHICTTDYYSILAQVGTILSGD